jgi:hypothetical protein
MLLRALTQALLATDGEPRQGWMGTYHASNGTTPAGDPVYDTFAFGSVAIENSLTDGGFKLEDDISFHCDDKSINSVLGMILGHSEGGEVNVPNDTALWDPAKHAGLIQGAKRWSEISKLCPQITGVVIDDFLGNYVGNQSSTSCAKCPSSNPYVYGSKTAGYYCCRWKPDGGHCRKPPIHAVPAPAPPVCCLLASYNPATACQGVASCGNNPKNHSVCVNGAISLNDLRDIKGALQGKQIDPLTGHVNHSSAATTPQLRLFIVWYTEQTKGFKDDGLLSEGLVDGVSLWIAGPLQDSQHADYTNQIGDFRRTTAPYNPDLLVLGGAYLLHSATGWLTPGPFKSIFNQSVELYDSGDLAGFFVFAGSAIPRMNDSLWAEWALPSFFEQTLQPWLGSAALRVTSADGTPLAGAAVTVSYCANSKISQSKNCAVPVTRKLTAADGSAVFSGWTGKATNATHKVEVQLPGYVAATFNLALVPGDMVSMAVPLSKSAATAGI